ncbi:uncharacterized protein [Henckelia pumila]|uniref:uncharacterized protein isoform X2 n=1 Tax=Henckelia pumila TaxID=405737 RepID=UPI003C6E49A7
MLPFHRRVDTLLFPVPYSVIVRNFRSDAALESLRNASEARTPNLVLYNYPSFSGAYGALFAHLYHSRLNLPCLILPFSSVIPFRVEDICIEGLKKCYFLDFIGPKGFASELSKRTSSKLIGFDHRQSELSRISSREYFDVNPTFQVNIEKSSSTAAYEYFSAALTEARSDNDNTMSLLNPEEREQMEILLKYIEDEDLRQRRLPDTQAFKIGLRDWRSKLNCVTNPWMYQQGFRADGNSELSDEIGKELSRKSVAAGLRPIGAVIYMQRNNLKMCLRTTDSSTDTSEIAKAYGGGGSPSSSSFVIRMDEYNKWLSPQ